MKKYLCCSVNLYSVNLLTHYFKCLKKLTTCKLSVAAEKFTSKK